jgi:two-component system, LytTR family, response regulator
MSSTYRKISVLIVDDEPLARDGLRLLLARDPDFGEIREAKDGPEAVAIIRNERPDLVFLDVQMPEMDGVSAVREVGADQMPAVVFVTAHDRYAIDAFEANAVDYLLKPVSEARFVQSLSRAKERIAGRQGGGANDQIRSLLEAFATSRKYVTRVAVRNVGKTHFVELDEVDWMEAAQNYVQLHTGARTHLIHAAMNTLEKSLDPDLFLRIHRSVIVNVRRVREVEPALHGEYVVTLESGVKLQSGRLYNARLRALITNRF